MPSRPPCPSPRLQDVIRQTRRRLDDEKHQKEQNGDKREVSPEVVRGNGKLIDKIVSLRIGDDGSTAGGGSVNERMGLSDHQIMTEIKA